MSTYPAGQREMTPGMAYFPRMLDKIWCMHAGRRIEIGDMSPGRLMTWLVSAQLCGSCRHDDVRRSTGANRLRCGHIHAQARRTFCTLLFQGNVEIAPHPILVR
jgi:hypothetical protein